MNRNQKYLLIAVIVSVLLAVFAVSAFACYVPEEETDYCQTVEGIQSEDYDCPKEELPDFCPEEGYQPYGPCEEPKEEPKGGPSDERFAGSSTEAPGVCSDTKPGDVANINVVTGTPNDSKLEVQWSLPLGADKVHILYGEYGKPYEHALLNTPNDGNEVIDHLKNGVNYNFKVAGVNGCAVGNYSKEFDPMP